MMKTYKVCCLPGDGIGPEIMAGAKQVLDAAAEKCGFEVSYTDELIGGAAIDAGFDNALPGRTVATAKESDAVLLAAVGGPKWDSTVPGAPRPEAGLLGIRKQLELYINLRPIHIYPALAGASTLKPEVLEGVDMLIVRELTGGLYFGARVREPERGDGMGQYASDLCEYTEAEIARVVEFAFEAAEGRRGNVVSVDKANVLETSRLWRETTAAIAEKHPDVAYSNMLVDNTAMQLVANPSQFDVLVTENTFGDILSDEASMLTGSLGMLASASLGTYTPLFEPCHGSAPDIAGKGIANPIAQILSASLMCRYAFGENGAADMIEAAVEKTLDAGWRTPDIKSCDTPDEKMLGTEAMTREIIANL